MVRDFTRSGALFSLELYSIRSFTQPGALLSSKLCSTRDFTRFGALLDLGEVDRKSPGHQDRRCLCRCRVSTPQYQEPFKSVHILKNIFVYILKIIITIMCILKSRRFTVRMYRTRRSENLVPSLLIPQENQEPFQNIG